MASKQTRYTPEFRRQIVELHRSTGRSATSLSEEFGPTAWSICRWIKQADRDQGKPRPDGGLTTAEREELGRLRRRVRQLEEEREILSKAAAWFATESGTSKRSSRS